MLSNFNDMQQLGVKQFEAAAAAAASTAKGMQAIAAETVDLSQKTLEKARSLSKSVLEAKKIDDFRQAQSEFFKAAYGDFIDKTAKVQILVVDLTNEAMNAVNASFAARRSVAVPTLGAQTKPKTRG